MPLVSIIFGVLLTGLGAYGYLGADEASRSVTALIPAFVGVPLIICGALALQESMLKHAMHAAAMFGLLGALASGGRALMKLFSGDEGGNTRATTIIWIMFALCAVFVGFCVKSFIDARRRREAAESASG